MRASRYRARVASLTGGTPRRLGELKTSRRQHLVERDAARRSERATALDAAARDERGQARTDELADRRARALGVDRRVASARAQRAVLERVDAGKNTLAVLGTGRGKSFCFQFAAAMRAFAGAAKTLVVYPLRALANDQYEALRRTLDPLGLRCFRANGSIDNEEREELFEALREGAWDVVLATPEFLEFHRDALRGAQRAVVRRRRRSAPPARVAPSPGLRALGGDDRGARRAAGPGAHGDGRRRRVSPHRRRPAHRGVGDRSDRARESPRRRRARHARTRSAT